MHIKTVFRLLSEVADLLPSRRGGGEGKGLVSLVSTTSCAAALRMGRYVMIVFRGELTWMISQFERGELAVLFVQTPQLRIKLVMRS